jgi:hypothetical protein
MRAWLTSANRQAIAGPKNPAGCGVCLFWLPRPWEGQSSLNLSALKGEILRLRLGLQPLR